MQDLILKGNAAYYDSRAIAEMVEKRHADLLRDIENYISVISENAILRSLKVADFFVPSSYKVRGNNKTYPCYLVTKMGCDMIANKMTGEKGTLFSALYVQRFNKMERLLMEKSTVIWQEARAKNIELSKKYNEVVKMLVDYAAANGSRNAVQYYRHMNDLIDGIAGISSRDNATLADMKVEEWAMMICAQCICECISKNMYYKDIYQECKYRLQSMKQTGLLAA